MSFGGLAKIKLGRFWIALAVSVVFGFANFSSVYAAAIDVSNPVVLAALMSTGGEVRLASDIVLEDMVTINDDFSLDLNGHTLSFANIPSDPDNLQYAITTYGVFTVTDSSAEQTGKITSNLDFTLKVSDLRNPGGKLVLESGTIDCQGLYCVRNYDEVTVNGGKITGNDFTIYSNNNSKLTMNGGEVIATGSPAVRMNSNAVFTLNDGFIQVGDNGSAVILGDSGAKLIMDGGTIDATHHTSATNGAAGVGAYVNTEAIINGGTINAHNFAVYGNGSGAGEQNDGRNARITVNGGTLNSTAAAAIYAPQRNGVTTINGGTLNGGTSAVEVRAGDLIVTGGTLNGNQDRYEVEENTNGSTTTGAAIAVAQHTTKQPINVTVTGGVFNANMPFSHANPAHNPEEDLAKISFSIAGGEFYAYNTDGEIMNITTDPFIEGGIFNFHVTSYVVDGYGEAELADGRIEVTPMHDIVIDAEAGAVTIDKTSAPYKSRVEFTVADKADYEKTVEAISNGAAVTVENGGFVMPDADVTIRVKYTKITPDPVEPDEPAEPVVPEEDGPAVPNTGRDTNEISSVSIKNLSISAVVVVSLGVVMLGWFGKGVYNNFEKRARRKYVFRKRRE